MNTKEKWTPVELIREMTSQGWQHQLTAGIYKHRVTGKEIDLHAVQEDGRMLWELWAEVRQTPPPF